MQKSAMICGRAVNQRAFKHCLKMGYSFAVTSYLTGSGDRFYADNHWIGPRNELPPPPHQSNARYRHITGGIQVRYRVIVTPKKGAV